MSASCGWCGKPVERRSEKGRAPRYCNPSHRQLAYQERRANREADQAALEADQIVTRGEEMFAARHAHGRFGLIITLPPLPADITEAIKCYREDWL